MSGSKKVGAVGASVLVAAGAVASGVGVAQADQTQARHGGKPAESNRPCPAHARACVDLVGGKAWLQGRNGEVTYGPVSISSGMPNKPTPTGEQRVTRKVRNEWSKPFNAPMPNAVYFGKDGVDNGIAFHSGDPNVQSNGCIHLLHGASRVFFDVLKPGDVVFVY